MKNTLRFVVCVASTLGLVGCGLSISPSNSEATPTISPAKFQQTIDQDSMVLVKFGAPWCGPCRQVDKELKSLESELPTNVQILKVDVDENPDLAEMYAVSSIPRMLLVQNGEVIADEVGYMSKKELISWIAANQTGDVQANPFASQ